MKELVDFMVTAKMEHKEYEKCSDKTNDMELKELYMRLSEQEKEGYKMMKEYVYSKLNIQ